MQEFDIRDLGIPENMPFAVRFISSVPIVISHKKTQGNVFCIKECLAEILQGILYLRKPLIISSSACFSVRPKVISFISCSPAILPMAAS